MSLKVRLSREHGIHIELMFSATDLMLESYKISEISKSNLLVRRMVKTLTGYIF